MLGIGDIVSVYKANMIIPQIAENKTCSGNSPIAEFCPACGKPTKIMCENDVETLHCINPECSAKKIKSFTLFVSRDALNMDGISESTLEKFIAHGFIHEYSDLFRLSEHRDEICAMDGFGVTSYENIIASVEKSRNTNLARVLYAIGIPNIGVSNAKVLCREYDYDVERLINASADELSSIDGVGEVIATSFRNYMDDENKLSAFNNVLNEVTLEKVSIDSSNEAVSGKTFVITGSLNHFDNRNDLKNIIENMGGKVAGSVSAKTDYLINNDVTSNSSKNKKAHELSIPIIDENEAMRMLGLA